MEYFPDCFDAFEAITRAGVIVVEAGGNGQMNLDSAVYGSRFNRGWRDSGAIIVGASLSTARSPNTTTNSGSRIDVHAWGQNVVTTGYGDVRVFGPDTNQFYTTTFAGTSSASPIVAGAVLSIQGILKARWCVWRPLRTGIQSPRLPVRLTGEWSSDSFRSVCESDPIDMRRAAGSEPLTLAKPVKGLLPPMAMIAKMRLF
jgi:hypothetical protein